MVGDYPLGFCMMGYGFVESFPVTCQQVLDFNNDLGKLYKYSIDCNGASL